MKIGIIGYGHVGKLIHKEFPDANIYDKNLGIGTIDEINNCDVAFIAVPTPQGEDGLCDTSIVEDVISKLKTELIIIRSTVYVGFTDYASEKYGKNIVFQPEYYGETISHPFKEHDSKDWITFGGNQDSIDLAIEVYKGVKNSNIKIYQSKAKDIEMAKYMENAFFAMKVSFVNEMYDIAKGLGANFNQTREAWLADPRIGSSHTFVYKDNRGYGGKCLPKDIASIHKQAEDIGVDTKLTSAIISKNNKYKNCK